MFLSLVLLDKRLASSVEFRAEPASWAVTFLVKGVQSTFFSRPSPVFRCCKYFFYLIYFPPPTYDVYINIQDCCVGSSFIHIIVSVVFDSRVEGLHQFLYSFFLISNTSKAVLDSLLMNLMCMLLSTPLTGKVG